MRRVALLLLLVVVVVVCHTTVVFCAPHLGYNENAQHYHSSLHAAEYLAAEPTHVVQLMGVNEETGERVYRVVNEAHVTGSAAPVAAWGKWSDQIATTGWAYLELHTNSSMPNAVQAEAAGFFEGQMTALRIYQNVLNTGCNAPPSPKVGAFIDANNQWIAQQIAANPQDEYWQQVALVEAQLSGIYQGYKANAPADMPLSLLELRLINLGGDMEDLEDALKEENVPASTASARPRRRNKAEASSPVPINTEGWRGRTHCTAMVKLLDGNADIYVAQDTWSSFQEMMRIYKMYDMAFRRSDGSGLPGAKSAFSSTPGSLFSGDDFYIMSPSRLVTQETTIGICDNDTLYPNFITPQSVMEWTRNIVANRLANSGSQWVQVFAQHNSGTYNNQWMIVDYKVFTPGQKLLPNTLWVHEQLPGHTQSADLTSLLETQRYFGSYNAPYFPNIFQISGCDILVKKYGNWFSYDKTARALIMKRDHGKINNMEAMKRFMRYNDFQHDPLSRCDGCNPPYTGENAIAARCDLNPQNGTYPIGAFSFRNHAGIDSKVTSYSMAQTMSSWAISSPTYDQQPPFRFDTFPMQLSHVGLPNEWQFPWVVVNWTTEDDE